MCYIKLENRAGVWATSRHGDHGREEAEDGQGAGGEREEVKGDERRAEEKLQG